MQIPKRIASAVINSLKGRVVPRTGLPYITVGRVAEIDALLRDVEIISEGGASFRFIVGKYGSGKSFLLQTIRSHVMDKGFVVVDADLSPERRLQGTKGQGLATYKELMKNMSTKTRPDGGALSLILDRWISSVQSSVMTEKGVSPENPGFSAAVDREIASVISSLSEMVHGFDFTRLLTMYCHACNSSDDETKAKVIKWFRGEYTTKTEAKNDLGVNIIITDDDWYEYLKLFALFLKMAGYSGMMILIDELVNIYKIPNAITRQYNYEKILTMYNDTLQGKAKYLGIIMGGTPQCIEYTRRGVYSYEALRSRLSESRFGGDEIRDMMAPVIRLTALTYEEMLVLTEKLADIHAGLFGYTQRITQEEMVAFLQTEFGRIGADSHITPREVIRDFIGLLDIAFQSPAIPIAKLIGQLPENYDDSEDGGEDKMFAEFDIGGGKYGRLRPLCSLYPGLHLPQRLGVSSWSPGCCRRGDLRHSGECSPVSLNCIRQDRSSVFSHTYAVFRGYAPVSWSCLHRTAEGSDQRPVLPSFRALQRGGDPGLALARRCCPVPQD